MRKITSGSNFSNALRATILAKRSGAEQIMDLNFQDINRRRFPVWPIHTDGRYLHLGASGIRIDEHGASPCFKHYFETITLNTTDRIPDNKVFAPNVSKSVRFWFESMGIDVPNSFEEIIKVCSDLNVSVDAIQVAPKKFKFYMRTSGQELKCLSKKLSVDLGSLPEEIWRTGREFAFTADKSSLECYCYPGIWSGNNFTPDQDVHDLLTSLGMPLVDLSMDSEGERSWYYQGEVGLFDLESLASLESLSKSSLKIVDDACKEGYIISQVCICKCINNIRKIFVILKRLW